MNFPRAPRPLRGPGERPDVTAGLAFSGLLIAVSFVALIIPLAVFHAAQVAAALRLRTAVLLLCAVVGLCLLLGVLAGLDAFLMGGLVGFVWTPLLSLALYERSRSRPKTLSCLLFFLPVAFLFAFTLRAPQVANLEATVEARFEKALQDAKPLLESSAPSSGETPAPSSGAAPARADFAETARAGFEALKGSQEFAVLSEAAALSPWQRLLWMVFGDGSHILFLMLTMTLGNLFFLDVAFAQVERVRAAARYVSARAGQFPPALVESLSRFRFVDRQDVMVAATEPEASVSVAVASDEGTIVSHRKEREGDRPFAQTTVQGATLPLWKRLFARRLERGHARMWGYVFEFAQGRTARGWELKYFALPLPLVLAAVAVLAGLGAAGGDAQGVFARFEHSPALPWAGASAVLSFFVLTVVAFQGAVALYMRLPPFLLVVSLLVFFIVGSTGILTPLVLLAALGGLGLLDYAYDFRGRRSPSTP